MTPIKATLTAGSWVHSTKTPECFTVGMGGGVGMDTVERLLRGNQNTHYKNSEETYEKQFLSKSTLHCHLHVLSRPLYKVSEMTRPPTLPFPSPSS